MSKNPDRWPIFINGLDLYQALQEAARAANSQHVLVQAAKRAKEREQPRSREKSGKDR